MDVKYQIFVSSTFEDLKEERRGVIEAILNLGHIPVGMELFQANDDTQWNYITRRISECDYYVLLVAERYGSEKDGKSYTQMEYEYAVEQQIPAISFLLDPDTRKNWPSKHVEFDKKDKVENFRSLCKERLVKFWKNADDLALKVSQSLFEITRERPGVGWVRASNVPSENVLNELASLSEEKRRLQAQISALSGEEALIIPSTVAWRLRYLSTTTISEICDYKPIDQELSLLDHFEYATQILIDGCMLVEVNEQIENVSNLNYDSEVAENFLRVLITNKIVQTNSVFDTTQMMYTLSDEGKDFVMYMKEWKMRQDIQELV